MPDLNAHWRSLADRGYEIELAGAAVDTLDAQWIAEPAPPPSVELPEPFQALPDYELMEHAVGWTRLWKDLAGYHRQERVRSIFAFKPELVV